MTIDVETNAIAAPEVTFSKIMVHIPTGDLYYIANDGLNAIQLTGGAAGKFWPDLGNNLSNYEDFYGSATLTNIVENV